MMIKIQNMEMDYRNGEVSSIQVLYRIEQIEENLSGTGKIFIDQKEYDGKLETLQEACKQHVLDTYETLDYEIRSTNMVYEKNEIKSVQVIFRADITNRELNIRGNFEIDAEEYNQDPSVEALEEFAKDFIRGEAELA